MRAVIRQGAIIRDNSVCPVSHLKEVGMPDRILVFVNNIIIVNL